MIKRLMVFCLACFGSSEDFLATRQGAEADFWQRSRGSVLQAARQWPQGLGWYFLAKRFFLRQVVPPVLVFGATGTLLFAGFGGWVAMQEEAEIKQHGEARKQAFEHLQQRIEKAKQEAANGQK